LSRILALTNNNKERRQGCQLALFIRGVLEGRSPSRGIILPFPLIRGRGERGWGYLIKTKGGVDKQSHQRITFNQAIKRGVAK
jgi:hypothetical protein